MKTMIIDTDTDDTDFDDCVNGNWQDESHEDTISYDAANVGDAEYADTLGVSEQYVDELFPEGDNTHQGNQTNPSFGAEWHKDEVVAKLNELQREKSYQEAQLRSATERLEKTVAAGESTSSAKHAVADAKFKFEAAKRDIRIWEGRMPRK